MSLFNHFIARVIKFGIYLDHKLQALKEDPFDFLMRQLKVDTKNHDLVFLDANDDGKDYGPAKENEDSEEHVACVQDDLVRLDDSLEGLVKELVLLAVEVCQSI